MNTNQITKTRNLTQKFELRRLIIFGKSGSRFYRKGQIFRAFYYCWESFYRFKSLITATKHVWSSTTFH